MNGIQKIIQQLQSASRFVSQILPRRRRRKNIEFALTAVTPGGDLFRPTSVSPPVAWTGLDPIVYYLYTVYPHLQWTMIGNGMPMPSYSSHLLPTPRSMASDLCGCVLYTQDIQTYKYIYLLNIYPLFSCKVQNFKKNSAPAWRIKSRQNKKYIAQFACKSRDKSNEPN